MILSALPIGLPGMLLTMGNAERTEPLLMIGPRGLQRVVNALRVIAPELPFEIRFLELEETYQKIQFDGFYIEAFKVNHNVICYGYTIEIDRIGKFNVEEAEKTFTPTDELYFDTFDNAKATEDFSAKTANRFPEYKQVLQPKKRTHGKTRPLCLPGQKPHLTAKLHSRRRRTGKGIIAMLEVWITLFA